MNQPNEAPIAVVIGTRPEGIKLLPLVQAMREEGLSPYTVVSGQHGMLLTEVFGAFGETPSLCLPPLCFGEDLSALICHLVAALSDTFRRVRPCLVILQGDTATAYAAALSAFLLRIPILHVEAGLRSGDPYSPFPEESLRRQIAAMALLHIAPTREAMEHLLCEGIPRARVFLLGNTVEDALRLLLPKRQGISSTVVFTLHRREHSERVMREIFGAVRAFSERHPELKILYPVHPSARVRRVAEDAFRGVSGVRLSAPMGVREFYAALSAAPLVMTDSGGVQEEAALLGIPTLVLRENTERESELRSGDICLGGTEAARILSLAEKLLATPRKIKGKSRRGSPSKEICKVILAFKAGGFDMPPLFRES